MFSVARCPPVSVIKSILSSVERVTFYGFLMALAKHDGANESIGMENKYKYSLLEKSYSWSITNRAL